MSYHVENPRFNELQKQLIVHEDGYIDAHKNECEPIVDYVYTLNGGDDKSRWAQLFGTPEKMAQTLAKALAECDGYGWHCDRCAFSFAPCCPRREVSGTADYGTLLEWLRGDEQHGDKAVAERDELIRDTWPFKKAAKR